MPLPDKIGIESHVTAIHAPFGSAPSIDARFRITDATGMGVGDWLNVVVVARVYDAATIQATGLVPGTPLAEGREVVSSARADWTNINLPLPLKVRGRYSVAAKVYSADPRYRQPFDPSQCILAMTVYGHFVRVPFSSLGAIYSGENFWNPLATEEIRQLVREHVVITDHDGVTMLAAEDHQGQLRLHPLQPSAQQHS